MNRFAGRFKIGWKSVASRFEFVRYKFPDKQVFVDVPALNRPRIADELRAVAHRHNNLPLNVMPFAQFPDEVPDGRGGILRKPADW